MRSRNPSPWTGLAVALASVAAITGANFGLREIAPAVSTGVVYLLAVLLVSSYWGLWLGVLTGVLSAAAFNFFHIPPTGRFTVDHAENWVALAVFFVAALVTSSLAGAASARTREAEQRRREADLTAEMARLLLGGSGTEDSLRAVGRRIAETFGLRSVTVEAAWAEGDERRKALPLVLAGDRVGTAFVPKGSEPSVLDVVQERVVPALAALVGAARKREELETQVIETKALQRADVMKTTLLRSVSHDLRSPLTAITVAADGLESETLAEHGRRELVSVIATESARLSRFVDNLLDLSRLQAGSAVPRADWCSLEEVVRAAAESVPAPPGGFDIAFEDELPMLRADAAQLERAIANVLENAVRYAGSEPVVVRARTGGRTVLLRVSDHGPGIPKGELAVIFEPFHSGEGPSGGSGLGLSIARGFVEANGGRLRADSLPGQGTSLLFVFPLSAERFAEEEPADRPVA